MTRRNRLQIEVLEDRVTPSLVGPQLWDSRYGIPSGQLGTVADFNNDSRLDVFTLQGDESGMYYATVLLGRSDGSFDFWESFTFYANLNDYPTRLYTGDIGCDGLR